MSAGITGSIKRYLVLNVSTANIIVPEVKTRKEAPESYLGATFNNNNLSKLSNNLPSSSFTKNSGGLLIVVPSIIVLIKLACTS